MFMQAWGHYGTSWAVVTRSWASGRAWPGLARGGPAAGRRGVARVGLNVRLGRGAADVNASRDGAAYTTKVDASAWTAWRRSGRAYAAAGRRDRPRSSSTGSRWRLRSRGSPPRRSRCGSPRRRAGAHGRRHRRGLKSRVARGRGAGRPGPGSRDRARRRRTPRATFGSGAHQRRARARRRRGDVPPPGINVARGGRGAAVDAVRGVQRRARPTRRRWPAQRSGDPMGGVPTFSAIPRARRPVPSMRPLPFSTIPLRAPQPRDRAAGARGSPRRGARGAVEPARGRSRRTAHERGGGSNVGRGRERPQSDVHGPADVNVGREGGRRPASTFCRTLTSSAPRGCGRWAANVVAAPAAARPARR